MCRRSCSRFVFYSSGLAPEDLHLHIKCNGRWFPAGVLERQDCDVQFTAGVCLTRSIKANGNAAFKWNWPSDGCQVTCAIGKYSVPVIKYSFLLMNCVKLFGAGIGKFYTLAAAVMALCATRTSPSHGSISKKSGHCFPKEWFRVSVSP